MGGYADLGQYYAEDFVLGNRLAEQGTGVRMATHVIRLMVQETPFWLSFRNQLRWMQSTRRSRPWGHLGSGLTFAMPFGLLGLVWGLWRASGRGVVVAAGDLCESVAEGGGDAVGAGGAEVGEAMVIYPLRDLLGVLWVGSYVPANVYYHGGSFRLKRMGGIRRLARVKAEGVEVLQGDVFDARGISRGLKPRVH